MPLGRAVYVAQEDTPGCGSAAVVLIALDERLMLSVEQRSVLVADDDMAIRRLVGLILTRDGFEVEEAANGRDALDCYGGRATTA